MPEEVTLSYHRSRPVAYRTPEVAAVLAGAAKIAKVPSALPVLFIRRFRINVFATLALLACQSLSDAVEVLVVLIPDCPFAQMMVIPELLV